MLNEKNISPVISLICPCHNEEEVLDIFIEEIKQVLKTVDLDYEILFINDGSTDNTLNKLHEIKRLNADIRIINLSRNFGKEAALTAGLDYSNGEVIIPIDVDLQDPPELIIEFIKHWKEGSEVVLAKRVDRTTDSFFKHHSANMFYKIHNVIADVQIPENVGDYRLITRKVLNDIKKLPENQRFMKGIFSWVGYKPTVIEYSRKERKAGKSSFNGWKLWNFALDGITSFSTIPLRIWLYVGFFISILSFVYGVFIISRTLILGVDVPGYASLLTAVLFLGGIQLIGIGILGEYVGRIYFETKKRPIYIGEEIL